MENKKNSKKTVKLLVVLIALLLIACSLLGFTLARYITEERDGQGGVNIAQWNIYDDSENAGEGSVRAMLSPNKDEYDGENPRENTVALEDSKGFRITNKSDVKAIVTLKITNKLNFYSNSEKDEATGLPETVTKPTTGDEWNNVELSQIITAAKPTGAGTDELALVQVYAAGSNTPKQDAGIQKSTAEGVTTYTITLDVGEKLEVTIGKITWTTDLQGETWSDEDNSVMPGDLRDTWIGENVGSVGFAYSWSAVQGSQVPTP